MRLFIKESLKPESNLPDLTIQTEVLTPTGKRPRSLLTRIGLACGGFVIAGGISGASWGTSYVRAELVPKISQALSEAIDRPLELGAVEQVSLTGIRFGETNLPATSTDADYIKAKAIDIRFQPMQALRNQQLLLTVTLVEPTAYIDQDKTGKWLNLELEFDDEAKVEIDQIRLENATVTLAPQPLVVDSEPLDPEDDPWDISDHPTQMTVRRVNGSFSLKDDGQRLSLQMSAELHEQGKVQVEAEIRFDTNQADLALQTQALQLKSLATFVPTEVKIDGGVLNSDVKVQLLPDRRPEVTGTADLKDGAIRTKGEPNPFTGINGRFRFQGEEAILRQGHINFGQIPFDLAGKIHLQHGFDLNAKVHPLDAKPFMQTLQLEVPFPVTGVLKSEWVRLTGPFDQPILSGAARAAKPLKFDQVEMKDVRGSFSLNLNTDQLLLHQIELQPVTGGSITAQADIWLEEDNGKVNVQVNELSADNIAKLYGVELSDRKLGQINARSQITLVNEEPTIAAHWKLEQGDFPAQGDLSLANEVLRFEKTSVAVGDGTFTAEGELKQQRLQVALASNRVPLNQLVKDLPGRLQGQVLLTGNLKDLSPETLVASGQASVQLGSGAVNANLQASQGRWQAEVAGNRIPLSQIKPNLPGYVEANVNLNGSLKDLGIQTTQADGKAQLTGGVDFLAEPITTEFAWNGEKLQLKKAKSENFTVEGWITPNLNSDEIAADNMLDLNINIRDYDLAGLPTEQPAPVTGVVNAKGKVTGTFDSPQIDSEIQLDRLAIQDFKFEPQLRGKLQSQPDQQIGIDLSGKEDRIALKLNRDYRPTEFLVRLDQAQAEGKLTGDLLLAKLQNFSLDKLNFSPMASLGLGTVRGILAGDFEINLANMTQPIVRAAVEIVRPGIGPVNAELNDRHANDRFAGVVDYHEGKVALSQGILQLGNSRYALSAQADPATSQWNGQISTEQGSIEDLLSTLTPEELTALVQRFMPPATADANPAEPLPLGLTLPTPADLVTLNGTFSGTAALQGSAQNGMIVQFGVQGQDWRLADYRIRQFNIANAHFSEGKLTLPTVQAEGFGLQLAGKPQQFEARLGFAGQLSPDAVAGQVQLSELNLPQIKAALNLPIEMQGRVHAVANLSGQMTQPNVTGELHLQEVMLRDMEVQATKVGFQYIDRQFHLESWESLTDPQVTAQPQSAQPQSAQPR